MKDEYKKAYKNFLDRKGIDSQMTLAIEEMSELTKEICKYIRYRGGEKEIEILKSLKEEIADTLNMVEELEFYFGEDEIERIRQAKIERSKNL